MSVEKKVIAIIAEHLGMQEDSITSGMRLGADLNMDSLDSAEVQMACEKEFCVNLDNAYSGGDITIGELVGAIEKMTASEEKEMVNHPSHYQTCGVETIEMMRRIWGTDAVVLFCQMNAFKYRQRAGLKGNVSEDINKALWYDNYARTISK